MSLSEFHKWVKDVVRNACEEALIVEEFVPDPIFNESEGRTRTVCSTSDEGGVPHMCSFISLLDLCFPLR